MALTFVDTHNMIAFLTKSDASEGFNQIIDFLNASSIKYALTVNPNIYVSIIKQFWSSVAVKKVNDVPRLQALVDRKKVIITKDTIRDSLCLDDAVGIDCLPNEEIFTELARMGYKKPSTKLTFYKAFFSNEGAASVNDDHVTAAVDVLSIPSPTLPTLPPQPPQDIPSTPQDAGISIDLLQNLLDTCTILTRRVENLEQDKIAQALEITKLKQRVLSMYDDDIEPTELQEVVEVVTTAKLITEVVTVASAIIIVAAPTITTVAAPTLTTAPSARRRKGVVIRDPEETATPSTITHSEAKSKDNGKGILVEEPKPLKKQAQIKQDEAYARDLEAELNKNINWDDVIDQVQRKEKKDNDVMRYQALKRKPQTKA
nr:xylulose kinase-1 [Tanacetum cinerariifolium]